MKLKKAGVIAMVLASLLFFGLFFNILSGIWQLEKYQEKVEKTLSSNLAKEMGE